MSTRQVPSPDYWKKDPGFADEFKQKFEFTPEGISKRAVATVEFWKGVPNIRSPVNRAFQQIL